jgi:tRNA(Ser,Leu) C12 N-acetylase TAN1
MASRNNKTKQRKTESKRSFRSATARSGKKDKSSEDLNEVAARLMQQSELNTVNHAAAHLIRKSS